MALDLSDLALSVVILGIVTSIGATMLVNFRDAQVSSTNTLKVYNDTSLAQSPTVVDKPLITSVTCVNNATGVTGAADGAGFACINSNNYTVDATGNTYNINFKSASQFTGKNVNVTYQSYDNADVRWTLPNNASIGINEYGNWYKTIVIVGVAAVILGMIFLAFGKGARSVESAPAY